MSPVRKPGEYDFRNLGVKNSSITAGSILVACACRARSAGSCASSLAARSAALVSIRTAYAEPGRGCGPAVVAADGAARAGATLAALVRAGADGPCGFSRLATLAAGTLRSRVPP